MADPVTDWQPITTAPKDKMIEVYCPGVSRPTQGVLQGQWSAKNSCWVLNPYGQIQQTTLYPSMWRDIGAPPADVTPGPQ